MNRRRILRILSGVCATLCGVAAVAIYFVWTSGLLGPVGERASDAMFRFYLLYVAMLVFAGQALTGLPV